MAQEQPYFVLNVNPDRPVDVATGQAMLDNGSAVLCHHCGRSPEAA